MTREEKRLVERLKAVVEHSRRDHATTERMRLALAIVDIVRAKCVEWFEPEDYSVDRYREADIATVKGRRLYLRKSAYFLDDPWLYVRLDDLGVDVTSEGERAISAAIKDVAETKKQRLAEADARVIRGWLSGDD